MPKEKFFDISMPINSSGPVYPGDTKPDIKQTAKISENGYNAHTIVFGSHFATHIDAPFHMLENGKKLNEYPVGKFFGRGVMIDSRYRMLDADAIKGAKIKKDDIVLFCTNQSKKMHGNYFWGTKFITEELAKILIRKKVSMIGLDTFSPDKEPFPIHKLLLGNDILIIENLVNLDKLIGKKFDVVALPLNLEAGDGAPARVIARTGSGLRLSWIT